MKSRSWRVRGAKVRKRQTRQAARQVRSADRRRQGAKPVAAFRQRGSGYSSGSPGFYATEAWHEPTGRGEVQFVVQPPGAGYIHPVSVAEIRDRLELLPKRFTKEVEVLQLSRMTRKRALFPCYGMQWGPNVYLYPIEATLEEFYLRPPKSAEVIESRLYGGLWKQVGNFWRLTWTMSAIKDFYLNNVLIHEIGHVIDARNNNSRDRERFADWFAIQYGYRLSRGRISLRGAGGK